MYEVVISLTESSDRSFRDVRFNRGRCMYAINEHELRVGEDISVIGFDDIELA